MNKLFVSTILMLLLATCAFSADFSPTLLKLTADPVIQYDFDGSQLKIPVTVSGTSAGMVFSVFTREMAENIPLTTNGFLGWHQVNKVDTCIYYSSLKSVSSGSTTMTWDGRDMDGGVVPAGDYTYYLWAYDNQGVKIQANRFNDGNKANSWYFQEVDENGLPMSNPIYVERAERWRLGKDPNDISYLETTTLTLTEGWRTYSLPVLDPNDFNYYYVCVNNADTQIVGINKFKWVPNGESELQSDFGEEGFGGIVAGTSRRNPGVCTDGTYLYAGDQNNQNNEPDSECHIVDFEGTVVDRSDLTQWWSDPDALGVGGQMNGGPNNFTIRHGMIFLNCHCSCLVQMMDPARYLDSEDVEDFLVWTNTNGDYVLDHNFSETAALPWVCNDYNVGPYKYNVSADDNLFSIVNAYDVGAVSFGLLAPDGTGIGYMAFAGETAGYKRFCVFIDSETPFDGLYCDNMQTGGPHYEFDKAKADSSMYFLGHDTIQGVISNAVKVADSAPAVFTVGQNSPNPFNPTTTISLNLAVAGDVTVDVFNAAGQKVDTLAHGFMDAGIHSVVWNASHFSAGVYFYTVTSGGFSKTMKMTLLK